MYTTDDFQQAAQALLSDSPLAVYLSDGQRSSWLHQITRLLVEFLPTVEAWCLLPPLDSDRPPPEHRLLGNSLAFLDKDALYRMVPWETPAHELSMKLVRYSVADITRIVVAQQNDGGGGVRVWRFYMDDEGVTIIHDPTGPDAGRSETFARQLAARVGWPTA